MAGGQLLLSWKTIVGFASVFLLCEFIGASKTASEKKLLPSNHTNGYRKSTVIQHHHDEDSPLETGPQNIGGTENNWRKTGFKGHKHQVKESGLETSARDIKIRKDFAARRQGNIRWQGFGASLLKPRVHYSTTLYKKALREDNVEVDDHPLAVFPSDDSPKTVKLKVNPGGSKGTDNRVLLPTPELPESSPTPASPTEPEMPVTEEVTAPPTMRPTTRKAQPTRRPSVNPTNPPAKPTIVNIVPTQTPQNGGNNGTNINLNLEIGSSGTNDKAPATQSPHQAVAITQAPAPPPPQIIIAQPPPTPPPPQSAVIHAAPTSPPVPQPIIIHDAPSHERIVIHEAHSAEPVFVHEPHTDPLVIASPPSPPSVIMTNAVSPSQHSVVVAAPQSPSVMVASPMASPQGAIALMGLEQLQNPMSALLMGQMSPMGNPLGNPMGYPLGMQSPFAFLPSPWIQPPLSPLAPALGVGGPYDSQLLMSLTTLFSNALQTTLAQSRPNALTAALVQAAIQAQTRNQPPDLLTTALTQALAQRMAPNNGQTDTNRLVQALTAALSQIQSQNPLLQPQVQPQVQPQPQAPLPAPLPAVAPIGGQGTAQPQPAYQVLPAQPVSPQPAFDSTSPSLGNVGKALASALVRAARNLARRRNVYDRGGRGGGRRRPRPFRPYYPRSYAPSVPRPFYYRSYGRRLGGTDRSPISRRSVITRWPTPPNQLLPRFSCCTCCRCC